MALTINDYSLNPNGDPASNSDGTDISVGVNANGLVIAAAFGEDDSLVGKSNVAVTPVAGFPGLFGVPQTPSRPSGIVDLANITPTITARDLLIPMIASLDTAEPFGIKTQSFAPRVFCFSCFTQTITTLLPAIAARVAIFSPQSTGNAILFSEAKLDNSSNGIVKFKVKSWDSNLSVGIEESLGKITYRQSSSQAIFNTTQGDTVAKLPVNKDDIVIWAASDTSANADVASIDLTNSGVSIQNLLAESFNSSVPINISNTKIGAIVRVDRIKSTGIVNAKFIDVTGGISALRLTPSFEVLSSPAAEIAQPPSSNNLGYFEVTLQVDSQLQPNYPDWLKKLVSIQSQKGKFGQIGNWPREALTVDKFGIPKVWSEIHIFGIEKIDFIKANIPVGVAHIFADRDEMEARRDLLISEL